MTSALELHELLPHAFPPRHQGRKVSDIVDLFDKCIIYRRRNTTAQYLSWRTAENSGCWDADAGHLDQACSQHREKATTLGDDWPAFAWAAKEWYAAGEAACVAAGRPVVHMDTESYIAATAELHPSSSRHSDI